jgi:hypothetical protein
MELALMIERLSRDCQVLLWPLVDRTSRAVRLIYLPRGHGAEHSRTRSATCWPLCPKPLGAP